MIVLGADTDESSQTIAGVDSATGEVLGDKTIRVGAGGFAALLIWRAASAANGSGRSRIADMSAARWSGS